MRQTNKGQLEQREKAHLQDSGIRTGSGSQMCSLWRLSGQQGQMGISYVEAHKKSGLYSSQQGGQKPFEKL